MTPAHHNPFRAQRIDALPFEPRGTTWPALLHRLERLRLRGAIVGPHGSGKTTLLLALARHVEARGHRPRPLFRNRQGGWAIPGHWGDTLASIQPRDVLLVDGYGHLGPVQRRRVRLAARRASGLIVTAHHRRPALPTLIRTRTDPALLTRLVGRLIDRPIGDAAIAELHRRHRGNLRDALRELYDQAAQGTLRVTR